MNTSTNILREISDDQLNSISGLNQLTLTEIEEASGGILCAGVVVFAAGYAIGTALYSGYNYLRFGSF